jgi:Peptidase S46
MACRLMADMQKTYATQITPKLNEYQANINRLQRTYMQAQMDVFTDKNFYPDANSTLRLTYGQVKKSKPRDGMVYEFYTYLDGVLEKYKPGDYEFDVPQKLIDLYNKKDFGPYGSNGKQTVCFIAANHTTGGNSGSPALDAYGNLIGLNFDRAWEGTMSDINYDASICRNIMVDIRYVLFIVDKFAGAKNLIAEMNIKK